MLQEDQREWWVVAGDGMNWQTFDFGAQQP